MFLADYQQKRQFNKEMVLEKIPFFAAGFLVGLINEAGYGLNEYFHLPHMDRTFFSLKTVLFYVSKWFWPVNLSAFYPFPEPLPAILPEHILIFVIALALIILLMVKKNPLCRNVTFGCLFFLVTLAPALGRTAIYSDGGFASDRYMYIPMLGLLYTGGILLTAFISRGSPKKHARNFLVFILLSLCYVFLIEAAQKRVKVWNTTETLCLDIIAKYPNAANAQAQLGKIYADRGQREAASIHYEKAFRSNPTPYNQARSFESKGRIDEAIRAYRMATEKEPENTRIYNDLGIFYYRLNRLAEAATIFEKAIAINPHSADLHNNLGVVYGREGLSEKAAGEYRQAIGLDPQHSKAKNNLDKILKNKLDSFKKIEKQNI
jgi:tetratricopeptide (TPR) repeat protein